MEPNFNFHGQSNLILRPVENKYGGFVNTFSLKNELTPFNIKLNGVNYKLKYRSITVSCISYTWNYNIQIGHLASFIKG